MLRFLTIVAQLTIKASPIVVEAEKGFSADLSQPFAASVYLLVWCQISREDDKNCNYECRVSLLREENKHQKLKFNEVNALTVTFLCCWTENIFRNHTRFRPGSCTVIRETFVKSWYLWPVSNAPKLVNCDSSRGFLRNISISTVRGKKSPLVYEAWRHPNDEKYPQTRTWHGKLSTQSFRRNPISRFPSPGPRAAMIISD